jgi:hypothetical protein
LTGIDGASSRPVRRIVLQGCAPTYILGGANARAGCLRNCKLSRNDARDERAPDLGETMVPKLRTAPPAGAVARRLLGAPAATMSFLAYQQARFLAHSLIEDDDWRLSPDAASHPTLGFVRLRSEWVELIFWRGQMNWIERRIVGRALRRSLRRDRPCTTR